MAYASIATCISSTVLKNASVETIVTANPVPAGVRVRLLCLGGSGLGKAGASPSIVQLLWGTTLIREFGLTGTAFESSMDRLLISTGVEALKIVRVNNDSSDQGIVAWVEGYVLG